MQNPISIPVFLEEGISPPAYASSSAAGADVCAYIKNTIILQPQERVLIPTGIKMQIPEGFEIQVRPRSGLALKNGISVLNTPGTIDADYRGEIGIILINLGKDPFIIEPGMRIAQLILAPVFQAKFIPVETLSMTARGEGGFGHTGVHK